MNSNIYVSKVENFLSHKQNLKKLIFKIPKKSIKRNGESISHTDYEESKEKNEEYKNYFINEILNTYLKKFCENYNYKRIFISHLWFQIYDKNDFHSLHTHPKCNFTNIFYLELPSKTQTEIYDMDNKKINIEIEEGSIITFPGFYKHCSPKNLGDNPKIIISFNTDVEV